MPHRFVRLTIPLLTTLLLAGCNPSGSMAATPTPAPPTGTPPPPTATSIPLAARVNGEPITMAEFEAEVARYEAAHDQLGIELATPEVYRQQVLEALIDLALLAQGAERTGVQLTTEELSAKVDTMAAEAGGSETMGAWLAQNGYDLESFQRALRRETQAAAMTAQIASEVPEYVEQVHARHILVESRERGQALLSELEAGADFGQLAVENSLDLSTRVDGGDLGWFPRGVLTQPEVEQAAYGLQPGERSAVVESDLGFHIIEVVERGDHPLSPNARRRLERMAVEAWLQTARQNAELEILIDR